MNEHTDSLGAPKAPHLLPHVGFPRQGGNWFRRGFLTKIPVQNSLGSAPPTCPHSPLAVFALPLTEPAPPEGAAPGLGCRLGPEGSVLEGLSVRVRFGLLPSPSSVLPALPREDWVAKRVQRGVGTYQG